MFNFLKVVVTERKRDIFVVEPKFKVSTRDSDVMIRNGDFYAIWDEESGLWRKDESFVIDKIDEAVMEEYRTCKKREGAKYIPLLMDDSDSGVIDKWHKYCQKQLRDNFKTLDNKIIFANTETSRTDYASKKLPYSLVEGSTDAYDELMDTLYSPDERRKLEWAMGSIISGDSKNIQKFIVLYGESGTGKSTFLNIVKKLFDGYWNSFDSKALGSGKDFALESFKNNPLISIAADGNMSRLEDNTLINSIVSHEEMEVNIKHKSKYQARFDTMLFMGTNNPVRITDSKSGIIRRLIDVYPTGNLVKPVKKYNSLMKSIDFELGAIAYSIIKKYEELGPDYYNNYVPLKMISETNDFYDFMEYYYDSFASKEYVILQDVWELYQTYNEMAKVRYPLPRRQMSIELKTYFTDYKETYYPSRELHLRNVYFGFRTEKFYKGELNISEEEKNAIPEWLSFSTHKSAFNMLCSDCIAQLASPSGSPEKKWSEVSTKLRDIDTTKLHWVRISPPHIVIDFDLKDSSGNKSLYENIKAASAFPPTYAELSKSGQGIHLHYFYDGDCSKLSPLYSDGIEIKVFSGKSSLRRQLTKCNELQIMNINSGLPTVERSGKKLVDDDILVNERALLNRITKCLNKESHPDTSSNIDYIKHSLDVAYENGFTYDLSRLYQPVFEFAAMSTNQSKRCMALVPKMHFRSKDIEEALKETEEVNNSESPIEDVGFSEDKPIVFFDIEVFPNVLMVNWKFQDDKVCKRMINPSPLEIIQLIHNYRLIGYNNLRYDNIILYARAEGADIGTLYTISHDLIHGSKTVVNRHITFNAQYVSYLDLYDVATIKQSLKKWEIDLHIPHMELEFDWDQPLPEEVWDKVSEYCDNDVFATQKVYECDAIQGDIEARKILSIISGLPMNTPNNQHSARIIFGKDKDHKKDFVYTDLKTEFPEYEFVNGKSYYRGEEVGEGGAVRAEPGIYENVWAFDILSMHPHTIKALNLFGDKYTAKFYSLVELRAAIKHGDVELAKTMFDGKLVPYLNDKKMLKTISYALKIVINSVYGMTAAHFENAFRDPRNVDNIVAKRGALFILSLKYELEQRGVKVIHIKTDCIKISNPSEETKEFIYEYGKKYGYSFEVEHIFKKFCLVNNAVFIGKYAEPEIVDGKEVWWNATGLEFAQPVVYKTLFSHDPLEFYDFCETKNVNKGSIYLDFNEYADVETTTPSGKTKVVHELETDPDKRVFIGRIGLFMPVAQNGGLLKVKRDDKYLDIQRTKGYRWLEADNISKENYMEVLDRSYFDKQVISAKEHIEEFGSFEEFIA
jgi:DNA polymerase elongation subunit (family B)